MERIREWLNRLSPGSTPANATQTQDSDRAARNTRADHVTELQAKVSRLQQDILALSNAAGGPSTVNTYGSSDARMATLERELDEAQRELARYQGRI
jgi:hypothetical protein